MTALQVLQVHSKCSKCCSALVALRATGFLHFEHLTAERCGRRQQRAAEPGDHEKRHVSAYGAPGDDEEAELRCERGRGGEVAADECFLG